MTNKLGNYHPSAQMMSEFIFIYKRNETAYGVTIILNPLKKMYCHFDSRKLRDELREKSLNLERFLSRGVYPEKLKGSIFRRNAFGRNDISEFFRCLYTVIWTIQIKSTNWASATTAKSIGAKFICIPRIPALQ